MRFDAQGQVHTLDEDIFRLWESHGWRVREIVLPRGGNVWIVKAKPAGAVSPLYPTNTNLGGTATSDPALSEQEVRK